MEPSTQDLPVVLIYGPWIWKAVLALLVGAVLALIIALRRVRARAATRERLRNLDHGRDTDGVIRGTLGGSGDGPLAITLSIVQAYENDERAHWRTDELWVETADGRVKLEGELTVELGTSGVARRNILPANLPPSLVAAANELPRVETDMFIVAKTASVRAGDEVVVRGKLERAPGTEETTHREASTAWTMRPTAEEPIRLAARRPRAIIPRMPIWAMVLVGGLTAFVGYKVMQSLGEQWREECWDRDRYAHVEGFVELDAGDRCVRSAAMPKQTERAYESLYYALQHHAHRDDRSLARLIALADKAEGCRGVLDLLEDAGRWDDMAVHARRCKLPKREYEALVAIGRYDDAAKLPAADPLDDNHIYTLIMAQNWAEAAVTAELRAHDYKYTKRDATSDGSLDDAALYYKCLAELFRHHGGDTRALARLRVLEADERGQVCLPALVEAAPAGERAALLARYTRDRIYGYDVRRPIETQGFIEGTSSPYEYESAERALVKLDDNMGLSSTRIAWVAKLGTAPGKTPLVQASSLRWRAVAAVLDGDAPKAMQLAAEAVAFANTLDIRAVDLYPLLDVALLPASVALYSNAIVDIDLDTAGLDRTTDDPELRRMRAEGRYFRFGRLPLRAGRSISEAYFGPRDGYIEALVAAQSGDGAKLATYIGKERWWTEGDVLAVLPRVEHHRDELVTKLRWSTNHASWRYANHSPFDLAASAAVRREMFRAGGASPEAAYWDGVYKRIDAALDRPRLMALVLWDY